MAKLEVKIVPSGTTDSSLKTKNRGATTPPTPSKVKVVEARDRTRPPQKTLPDFPGVPERTSAGLPVVRSLGYLALSNATTSNIKSAAEVATLLSKIADGLKREHAAYRATLYEGLMSAVKIANLLKSTPDLWASFCELNEWMHIKGRPRDHDIAQALKFVQRWIFGGVDMANTKRASTYYLALSVLADRGVAVEDIPAQIQKNGGINKLVRMHAAQHRPPSLQDQEQLPVPAKGVDEQRINVKFTGMPQQLGRLNPSSSIKITGRLFTTESGHFEFKIKKATTL